MGHHARLVALTLVVASTACGDPLVVVGDFPGTFRIIAGQADSAGAGLASLAIESRLDTPLGLAADAQGLLYIADHANGRILAVTTSGTLTLLAEAGSGQGAGLRAPSGLALDGRGSLLIADPTAHRVWRFNLSDASLNPLVGTGERGAGPDTAIALDVALDTPTGVVAAPDGAVYFTEFWAHRVRRLDPDGRIVTLAGSRFPGLAGDGGPAIQARLRNPAGLDLAEGVLYIADSGNHRIRAVDLNSNIITTVVGAGTDGYGGDGGPAREALLSTPLAISLTREIPTLYIADSGNHRIRSVDLRSSRISTFAGSGNMAFNGDLLATGETSLSGPQGLAISSSGLLYVSDTGHHIVRRTAVVLLTSP